MTEGGWPANDAERILSGPTGDSGSALQLRQFLRTYASLSLPQRARFQALVEQNEEGFEVSRNALLATSISDIQNVRSVDSLPQKTGVELFGIYEGMSAPERQRALRWIIDQESSAFGNQAQLQLPTLYATYRNLPKYERMRFLKLLDEASALPAEYPGWMVDFQNLRDPRGVGKMPTEAEIRAAMPLLK